ncbi:AfsR/SARP family transcriptional regulator [Micromonospora echinofusca]|uniref:Tetratricopeptide repeat protein n=1 Tax=Micromonospora echinofusca TaxID=47858 RepID=A0ABS3VZI9_MICEH|nr:BTAD domain-containing putative transcriptional regulator [Micromonospora echinofusca]MBO4209950.1 tetratricopeptide repeat protein [Micromonospora echinofusca]
MRWRVLGPVEVTVDGRVLPISRPQQRAVLALLLLNAGRVVSAGHLAEALWGDDPPSSARTQVQVCVSQIRSALRPAGLAEVLASTGGGYRLAVADDDLDLARFTHAASRARAAVRAGDPETAARELTTGLALWRGPALTGAAGAFVRAAADSLDEQRLTGYEQLASVELTLGRYDNVLRTLQPLVAAHPLREALVARCLLALAGTGQQAAALRLYADTRDRLVEELGVEPAAELTEAHLRILRQEVTPAAVVPEPGPGPATAPAQLPADLAGFTGRAAALRELDRLLPETGTTPGADTRRAVVVSAIGGTAGVGKTTLAVHWAHRVAHRFPDGQLYVNLRGFDLDGRAVAPDEALRGFLAALHVPPQRIPNDLDQQAALYRTLLADRRMLIVLDNARDCDQVRPLLPGAGGCLVVVTSRDRLTGLVVTEGAHPVTLDLLSPTESRELLGRRLGRDRAAAEPLAVDEIVHRCARLPLALAIVAARAAANRAFPLDALAAELAELAETAGPLDALDAGDPSTDVRAVFSWSYRMLDAGSARLFRLLGLHPGPDVAVPAVASLTGLPPARVRPLLATLTRAHLLVEPVPGRYALHDLLRAYAAELCRTDDSDAEREAARHRLFDHYLHTTHAADDLLDPYRLAQPVDLEPARPGVTVDARTDHAWATRWFGTEHQVLLGTVAQAAATGFDGHAWRLAAALTTYLDRRGHWPELAAVQHTALLAAQRQNDPAGQARAHRGLAICCTWLGRYDEAHRHYRRDLELYRDLGDDTGQAHTHLGISWVLAREGRRRDAVTHADRALALYRTSGYRVGQAKALNNLAFFHARLGDHRLALACCRQALALHEENGDRHGVALAWDNLGYVRHQLGQHQRALACYRRALLLHRELGDRYDEAEVLENMGDTHQAAGDRGAARHAWRDALAIFDDLDHPDTDRLRAKLAGPATYQPHAPAHGVALLAASGAGDPS